MLDRAIEHLAEDSIDAALELLDEDEHVASSLATLSDRGRQLRRLASLGLREVFVQSYRLVYRVTPDHVDVVAFVHGARDFEDPSRH